MCQTCAVAIYVIEVFLDGNWFRHTASSKLDELRQTRTWLDKSGFATRLVRSA